MAHPVKFVKSVVCLKTHLAYLADHVCSMNPQAYIINDGIVKNKYSTSCHKKLFSFNSFK